MTSSYYHIQNQSEGLLKEMCARYPGKAEYRYPSLAIVNARIMNIPYAFRVDGASRTIAVLQNGINQGAMCVQEDYEGIPNADWTLAIMLMILGDAQKLANIADKGSARPRVCYRWADLFRMDY